MRDIYIVHVINNFKASVVCGKRQSGANPSLVSQLCCEEKASYDDSPAYSFTASQGLAYEERDES